MNMDATADFVIRRATVADIPAIVRHRCEMFRDMNQLLPEAYPLLAEATARYLAEEIPTGSYVAWLVTPRERPDAVVAGGGLQLRHIAPRPDESGHLLKPGPQGLVVNVYTEKEWRRSGLGELVMNAIIEWSRANGVVSLVLHASSMGRPLYEKLGFTSTNEMSFPI
jgi:GNAT superfamily N-acetyltransferase